MEFRNTYEDPRRAAAYSELEFGGTYHLVPTTWPSAICHTYCATTSPGAGLSTSDAAPGARRGSFGSKALRWWVWISLPRCEVPVGDT
jgi:hypothetical protein